jgi:hypothetical protein
VGLRGGTWEYSGDDPVRFTLDRVILVPGVAVSGTVSWRGDGTVASSLRVAAPRGVAALLELRWTLARTGARALLTGWVGGERLTADMLAP